MLNFFYNVLSSEFYCHGNNCCHLLKKYWLFITICWNEPKVITLYINIKLNHIISVLIYNCTTYFDTLHDLKNCLKVSWKLST